MAVQKFNIAVVSNDDANPIVQGSGPRSVQGLINFLKSCVSGSRLAQVSITTLDTCAVASGTVTISSGSGTITATINGVASSVTWATSDTATATALAAKINAGGDTPNALVSQHVTASAASGVVTITAITAGPFGNAVTLAASGTGATASGTRLTGGSYTNRNAFTFC